MDYTEREREQRLEDVLTRSVKASLDRLMNEPRAPRTGSACPECEDGRVVVRKGGKGEFCGCSNYPDCSWTTDRIVGRRWVAWTLNRTGHRRLRIVKGGKAIPMRSVHTEPPTVDELERIDHNDLHVIYYTGAPDKVTGPQGYELLAHPRVLDVLYRQYTKDDMKIWSLTAGFGVSYPTRRSGRRAKRIPLPQGASR